MTSAYDPPRIRDAYPTIRGYVYQVDLTILRWLNLQEGQHLELERGEDIDLVGRALGAEDQAEERRLLEQVKHREENLTLRNAAALEVLANAAEHLRTSPGIDLRFCYSTNAGIGQERPSLFPTEMLGILVWEQIRRNQLTGPDLTNASAALRLFLTRAAQPKGLDNGVWNNFQEYLVRASDDEFSGFIRRFEWSTAQPDAAAMGPQLRALLQEHQIAADETEAQELYERLFLYVFKLLCQPGLKRLTPASLLEQFARPTLSASDRQLLTRVRDRLSILELRVEVVEVAVASLNTSVRFLARRQGMSGPLTTSIPIPDLGLPPLAPRLSVRGTTVAFLTEKVQRHAWTALHGAPDTGKSQLARLLVQQLGSCRGWIRLHHMMPPEKAGVVLDRALAAITGLRPSRARQGWYRNVCSRLGRQSLLVLDDLPRLLGNDPLSQRFVELVAAGQAEGICLLSTSLHALPAKLRATLGSETLYETETPALNEAEAREILAAYGASPAFLTEATVRFVNDLASRHPLLLSLAGEYLHRRHWRLDDSGLDGLLRGEHASGLAQDVVAQLMRALDEVRRELLYRLTLNIGSFTAEEVTALAAVSPPVPRPGECLQDLLGAWVQRDTEERLAVSPLVRAVGAGDLSPQTRAGCHLALGERIVGRRMSLFDGEVAVGHFLQAREFGRAGTLFLILLQKVAEVDPSADARSLLAMWAELPLPEEVDLSIRLLIRSVQMAVFPRFGRQIGYILDDIDCLLETATSECGWALTGLAIHAVTSLAPAEPDRALRYLRRSLTLSSDTLGPMEEEMALGGEMRFDDLLWSMVMQVDTRARLRDWLATAELLPEERFQRFFQSQRARLGCLVLADRLTVEELHELPEERRWDDVLASLEELEEWATRHSLTLLWACAIRSRIYAFGESKRTDQAMIAGQEALLNEPDQPAAQFLIAGAMGRFLVRAQRYTEARPLLGQAIRQPVDDYAHERMLFLLAASHSYGVEDAEAGVRYAREAVELGREKEEIPDIEVARACAELAVAQFLHAGPVAGLSAAFEVWSEAAERLFAVEDQDNHWKDCFVIFAHTTGYLAALATIGRPPSQTRDGEEYLGPQRGVFLLTHPERIAYYRLSGEAGVMWLLAQYAESVGNEQLAVKWLTCAAEAASSTRLTYMQATIGRDFIPYLLLSDRYEEAVDAGIKGCQALQAFRQASPQERDPFGEGLEITTTVSRMTPEQLSEVERFAVVLAVLPGFLRIGARAMEDRAGAFSAGRTLAAVCRQVSDRANDKRLWSGAAEILESACREEGTARELIVLSNLFDGESHRVLRVLGYLASSLHGNIDEAFQAQQAVEEVVFGWYPPDSLTHRRLLVPYIETFWLTTFNQARFQFRSPELVGNALTEARSAPANTRLQAILRAVRLGVTVRGFD